jgi:hypothetical protein
MRIFLKTVVIIIVIIAIIVATYFLLMLKEGRFRRTIPVGKALLTGKVYYEGKPCKDIGITLDFNNNRQTKTAITNSNGVYCFNIPPGEYILVGWETGGGIYENPSEYYCDFKEFQKMINKRSVFNEGINEFEPIQIKRKGK